MKKLIYLCIVAIAVVSCQSGNKYTINGTVVGDAYEGTNVYLQHITEEGVVAADTAVIQNNSFTFQGSADSAFLRFIALDETVASQLESRIPVLVEAGKMKVTFDSVVTVEGTKVNDAFTAFRMQQRELEKNVNAVIEQFNKENSSGEMTESRSEELRSSFDMYRGQLTDLNFDFTKEQIGNKLGEFMFMNFLSDFEPEQRREILDLAGDEFKSSKAIQPVVERLENYEKVAIGKKFTDFTLNDPKGNEMSLSDYAGKGKYVLVDFWASWCGPCRKEMPNVVAAYEKYKDKGFEIVGVSFDHNGDSWKQGLKDMKMTWPQMSDLLYWDSPVVGLYAIEFIPHTLLLDKDGTIIARNLKGKELDDKLAELMP